jgi:hypothetical protein
MAIVYPFTPTPYHEELFLAHQPIEQGGDWFIFIGAVASMFDQIETYARDQDDGTPGWGILLDIDRCPIEALPWLAQFIGVTIPPGLTDAQARAWVKGTDGFKRGSTGAIIAATQKRLTGNKTVFLKERDAAASPVLGGAYGLTVVTFTGETPDPANTLRDIIAQKPAGIILNYQIVPDFDYLALRTANLNYTAVRSAYATYSGVRVNALGT